MFGKERLRLLGEECLKEKNYCILEDNRKRGYLFLDLNQLLSPVSVVRGVTAIASLFCEFKPVVTSLCNEGLWCLQEWVCEFHAL